MASTLYTSIAPMTSTEGPLSILTGLLGRFSRRLVYLFVGFPISLVAFVMLVTGFSTGVGTLITFIGVPILLGTLLAARVFASVERRMLTSLVDMDLGQLNPHQDLEPTAGVLARAKVVFFDRQSWLDLAHGLVGFPVSVAMWTVAVTWCATVVGGLTSPVWLLVAPDGQDLPGLIGLGTSYPARVSFYLVMGLLAAITIVPAIFAAAWIRATMARLFLVELVSQRAQVASLSEGRDAGRSAETSTFRRLERDIHDGPQQRLVRLSMDLGRAELKATDADPAVREALADAKRQTTETLDELRALSRGIAPPVLVDRGLYAALEELVQRSAVPARAELDLDRDRFESHVESAVYFLVSESLTNAAKHAQASQVTVKVAQEDNHIWVTITDDGVGGAQYIDGWWQRHRPVSDRAVGRPPPHPGVARWPYPSGNRCVGPDGRRSNQCLDCR